jgi:sugar O-acyltransferase (sialic acid O-acetyltransferase NeuD family)
VVDCILYGVGSSYVYEVDEILRRLGWPVRAYVANQPGSRPDDLQPVLDVTDMPPEWLSLPVLFALITPGHRATIEAEARGMGFRMFPAAVDPTAVVARRSVIGEGTVVNAGAVVGARSRLGRFVSLNRSVSVGHDALIDDYASLGPAAVLCGDCTIGSGAFIGAGATLLPGVSIGGNAIVGAGSVVTGAVPAHSLVVGNPARVVRERIAGHNGVGVPEQAPG